MLGRPLRYLASSLEGFKRILFRNVFSEGLFRAILGYDRVDRVSGAQMPWWQEISRRVVRHGPEDISECLSEGHRLHGCTPCFFYSQFKYTSESYKDPSILFRAAWFTIARKGLSLQGSFMCLDCGGRLLLETCRWRVFGSKMY